MTTRLWLGLTLALTAPAHLLANMPQVEAGTFLTWLQTYVASGGSGDEADALVKSATRWTMIAALVAPVWLWVSTGSRWNRGVADFASAMGLAALLMTALFVIQCLVQATGAWGLAPRTHADWTALVVAYLMVAGLGTIVASPMLWLIARKQAEPPTSRPGVALGLSLILPALLHAMLITAAEALSGFGAATNLGISSVLAVMTLALTGSFGPEALLVLLEPGSARGLIFVLTSSFVLNYAILALIVTPLWAAIRRRKRWRDGVSDFWSGFLGLAAVLAAAVVVRFVLLRTGPPRDPATLGATDEGATILTITEWLPWIAGALLSVVLGALVGAFLLQRLDGARKATGHDPLGVSLERLGERLGQVVNNACIDLSVAIRVRERLSVLQSLFASVFAAAIFVWVLVLSIAVIAYTAMLAAGRESLSIVELLRAIPGLLGVILGTIVIAAPISFISRIHRRALGAAVVALALAPLAYEIIRINQAISTPASVEEPGVRDWIFATMLISTAPSAVVFLSLAVSGLGLTLAPRRDFMAGRGWRPGVTHWWSSILRQLALPPYLASLGWRGVWPAALFILALAFAAHIMTTAWSLAAPINNPLYPISIARTVETSIASFRYFCAPQDVRNDDEFNQVFMWNGGVASLPDYPLNNCVRDYTGRELVKVPIWHLLAIGFWGVFGALGLVLGRWARRVISRRYQRTPNADERPPILYLRAFRTDDVKVPARPHGVLPKLMFRPGAAGTLDELVLEAMSPYGPVVAIGRPDEALPPLGAARVYAGDGDWREIVRDLCIAAELIVVSVDAAEGVQWEVEHIIAQGHADKTLFLLSPQLAPAAAALVAARLFGDVDLPPHRRLIGGALHPDGGVFIAPALNRSAFATALAWWAQNVIGLPSNDPRATVAPLQPQSAT